MIVNGSEVWRGGVTSNYKTKERGSVWVTVERSPGWHTPMGLAVSFSVPSKGGGDTSLLAWIPPEAFGDITRAMILADPVAARRAFGEALVRETEPKPPQEPSKA